MNPDTRKDHPAPFLRRHLFRIFSRVSGYPGCLAPCFALLVLALPSDGRETGTWPTELAAYDLKAAPEPGKTGLRMGDRLAICGDSITEQKQYSLIIESYLAACLPELGVTCRQFGWSGEQASGFLRRMENDVLRFQPTIATTCYGMNDFRYAPYDEKIAAEYRKNLESISELFAKHSCRVIIGSPGIIDSVPAWVKTAMGTQQELNLALSKFRNIALEVAEAGQSAFADVYRPMLLADLEAKRKFGPDFKVAGKDGVHPGWAGQVVMAHAFLKAMGMDGNIGMITWDAAADKAVATEGHDVLACRDGRISLRSTKLPFSPGPAAADRDDSIRAGMALVPFDDELNRFVLKVASPAAEAYQVTWGTESRRYTAAELSAGVSLSKDFHNHPLVPAFQAIWKAAADKQAYETRQIKTLVHGPEGAADMEATIALTEKTRSRLTQALADDCTPAVHELIITPAD